MKKLFALVLILAMVLTLASCGGNSGTTNGGTTNGGTTNGGTTNNGGSTGTSVKDITDSNWQEVIKENFEIEVTMPDGWSVRSAKGSSNSSVTINFRVEGDTDLKAFSADLYALCAAQAVKMTDFDGEVPYASAEEAVTDTGIKLRCYLSEDDYMTVNCYDNRGSVVLAMQRDSLKG